MSFNPELKIGEIITNKEMVEIFECANMGGMRRSRATNTLVIVSDHTKGLYEDKWIGDILHYTGMGKKGDQNINYSQNRTLNESNFNNVDVHCFEVFEVNKYIYVGKVKLVAKPYQEKQKDEDGLVRNVWIFPVKPIEDDGRKYSIDIDIIKKNYERKEKQATKLKDEELLEKINKYQSKNVSYRITVSKTYDRNIYVVEYAKRMAEGICRLCNREAPFKSKSGEPYLEVHHIKWLSRGGTDTIDNTVALCPNCHRKMHVVDNEEDKRKLLRIAKADVGKKVK